MVLLGYNAYGMGRMRHNRTTPRVRSEVVRASAAGRRRRLQTRPWLPVPLGRDFTMAVALLVLGLVLPMVSAISEQRGGTPAVAHAAVPLPTAIVAAQKPAPGFLERLIVPLQLPTPIPQPPANGDTPGSVLATLVPIIPTENLPPTVAPLQVQPVVQPAQDLLPPGATGPILMYHYVRVVDAGIDPLGYDLSVAPDLFAQQIDWLAQQGYTGVRLDVYLRCTGRVGSPLPGETCPAHPVALTFDDGYADAFEQAAPVLARHGFTATFYVVNNFVGQPGYLTWEQVMALRDAGMEIGAHTLDHLMLTRLEGGEMQRQIAVSKADLEQRLGTPVRSFSYPVGDYDWAVEEQVRAAGFENATSTRWDDNYGDPLGLPRRRVAGGTTVDEFGWIVGS